MVSVTHREGTTVPMPMRLGRVGRYSLLRVLGQGGMGLVYEAWDSRLQREVALKVMRPRGDGALIADSQARLMREARVMASLTHPNVVSAYDVGIVDGQVYVAMQLIRGTTLRTWIQDPARTFVDKVRVLLGAGAGLVAAHAAQIIHRDFKPDNVLIDDRDVPRVTDFGLARRLDLAAPHASFAIDPLAETKVTMTGAVLGTPAYMSPEQACGLMPTEAADQFSFCVTAWELFAGHRPFAGDRAAVVLANVLAGEIVETPAEATWPPALRRVLRRGLSRRPESRYPELSDLLAELDVLLHPSRPLVRRWLGLIAVPVLAAGTWGALAARDAGVRNMPVVRQAPIVTPIEGPTPLPSGTSLEVPTATVPRNATASAVIKTLGRKTAPGAAVHRKPRVAAAHAPSPARAKDAMHEGTLALQATDRIRSDRSLLIADIPDYANALSLARAAVESGDEAAISQRTRELRQRIEEVRIDAAFVMRKASRLDAQVGRATLSPEQARALQHKLEAATAAAATDRYVDANRHLTEVARLIEHGR